MKQPEFTQAPPNNIAHKTPGQIAELRKQALATRIPPIDTNSEASTPPAADPAIGHRPSAIPQAILLILCILSLSLRASAQTTYTITNDLSSSVYVMLYGNSGGVFFNSITNIGGGTNAVLSGTNTYLGVAVEAGNSQMARLATLSGLPSATGGYVSWILSNSWAAVAVPASSGAGAGNIGSGGNPASPQAPSQAPTYIGSFAGNGNLLTNLNLPVTNIPLVTPRLRLASSQGRIPWNFSSGNNYFCSRQAFYTPIPLTNIVIVVDNFYTANLTGSGGTAYITASIEPTTNLLTRITWKGNAYTNVPSGQLAFSDSTGVNVPSGIYWIRLYYTNSAGIVFNSNGTLYDQSEYGPGVGTDKTMGGSIGTPGIPSFLYGPMAVISTIKGPSIMVLGDSRDFGIGETPQDETSVHCSNLLCGIDRVIAPYYPCGNFSFPGLAFSSFVGSPAAFTNYWMFTNYADILWSDLGINGLSSSTLTLASNFYALSSLPVVVETLSPYTTSSDGFTSLQGQTATAGEAYRQGFNNLVRSSFASLVNPWPNVFHYVDVAAITESGLNSGKWVVWASTNWTQNVNENTNMTLSGLHGQYFYELAAASVTP